MIEVDMCTYTGGGATLSSAAAGILLSGPLALIAAFGFGVVGSTAVAECIRWDIYRDILLDFYFYIGRAEDAGSSRGFYTQRPKYL
jgi:hypothetical protein